MHPLTDHAPRRGATATEVHRAVDELASALRDRGEEIDGSRRLPDDVVAALHRSGIFRLGLPAELGGIEAPLPDVMAVVEHLAAANGSVAWCAAIGAGSNVFSGHLPEAGARTVFSDPDQPNATMLAPVGTLRGAGPALRLTGRWPFTSNILHSGWAGLGAFVERDRDSPPPIVFVPVAELTIDDTWYSDGLRGTGSHHVEAVDVAVPPDHCYFPGRLAPWPAGPRWRLPLHSTLVPMLTAVPLGLARGALDAIERQLIEGRTARRGQLADDPVGLADLAAADSALRAARASVRESLETARACVERGEPVPRPVQARLALACSYAVEVSVDVTATAHRLGGGAAAYRGSDLLRALADVHAARQHLLFSRHHRPELALIAAGVDRAYPPFVT